MEEVHELIEAIDYNDSQKFVEELGDVLFTLVFIGKLGEKEGRFTFEDAIQSECKKLIRRHPHIFGQEKVDSVDDVLRNWEMIKKGERVEKGKNDPGRDSSHIAGSLSRAKNDCETRSCKK